MDPALKWIGGATAAIVLVFAGITLGSRAFADEEPAPQLTAEDVLGMGKPANDAPTAAITAEGLDPVTPPPGEEAPRPSIAENEPFVIKRVLDIREPIKYGQWFWDDEGVPDGPLVMTVDLEARVLSVFRGGYEIGATAVLLGTDDHPTPLGRFPILTKERHNVSEKYDNAPMPWTLRLTWDGVAIHGGSQVENGYASHGCIGTPDEFVSRLFAIAKKGDVVIITRGKKTGVGQSLVG
ncbi:L,D-transpeptidase family protein [Altererythrobacter sp. CC-YST694]|uniref:L,D-transpeptidase family protein n=1 Tax=Altererythrobacter sp. CC-YST694 TaxID=2755038 RepID=UPI001D0097F7|nr:L,D-transpeptidase family protein [Altererythrobacter sp. CC-YST694]MCB5426142.1 L,D-transpeptidase family protein [Altererythrobacter sp. CC-YST694]